MNYQGQNGFMGNIPQGTGYQYNPNYAQAQPKYSNALTQEEIQKLLKKDNRFSLAITETGRMKGICTHRRPDGSDSIIEDPTTGICRCEICEYEFLPLDATTTTKEQIQGYVDQVIDVMQTIKMIYLDMPKEAAREYFQIIPLIEKLPVLFEYAVKDYAKHENVNVYSYNNRNMSTMNLFNMLVGTLNGAPQGAQYGQQPYVAPQQQYGQQPYVTPQQQYVNPAFNPALQYQNPATNGFGYMGTAPVNQGYNPQTTGYQYNPAQEPQQAPQANAQQAQPTQDASVNNTFKA